MSAAVGNKLRQARQAKNIPLEQAAKETYIHPRYLRNMEAGNFDIFPSQAQRRGFLRAYADFLSLDGDLLLDALEKDALMALMPPKDDLPDPETEETQPQDAPHQADINLASMGETLESQRNILGLSLEDVEQHTHLKIHYLQALENGDLDSLPSMAQGSGMLKNYANFLSLDPEPLLLRFAERLQSQLAERQKSQPSRNQQKRKPRKKSKLARRIFSKDLIIGGALIIFLMVFALWAGIRISSARSDEKPEPTVPSIADVLLPSPTASVAPTPTETIFAPLEEASDTEVREAAPA
ncbi:MAG: helix-turn-helix domain-containing protein, partial [Chloroflexota bacterium]|nr:helix-turn-helix domain-containing protein [Chloroflexota bacterium]